MLLVYLESIYLSIYLSAAEADGQIIARILQILSRILHILARISHISARIWWCLARIFA